MAPSTDTVESQLLSHGQQAHEQFWLLRFISPLAPVYRTANQSLLITSKSCSHSQGQNCLRAPEDQNLLTVYPVPFAEKVDTISI